LYTTVEETITPDLPDADGLLLFNRTIQDEIEYENPLNTTGSGQATFAPDEDESLSEVSLAKDVNTERPDR
jgi:hypothetical protein